MNKFYFFFFLKNNINLFKSIQYIDKEQHKFKVAKIENMNLQIISHHLG